MIDEGKRPSLIPRPYKGGPVVVGPPNNELTKISYNPLKRLLNVSKTSLYDYLWVTLKRLLDTLFRLLGGYGLRTALRLALALAPSARAARLRLYFARNPMQHG